MGMKVAVVIPVGPNADDDHLQEAVESVTGQTHQCESVTVCDGRIGYWNDHSISLPLSAGDIGSTPRAIGSLYAFGQGFDAVCWLDADNWLAPDHVEKLVAHHKETGKPIVASGRTITDVSGKERAPCTEMQPGVVMPGFEVPFLDTNTIMVTRDAIHMASFWSQLRKDQHKIGDKLFSLVAFKNGLASCHYEPTVYYRSTWAFHYEMNGWSTEGVDIKRLEDL